MKWRPYGPEAALFSLESKDCPPAQLCADVENDPPRGFLEATPAYETVLVEFRPGTDLIQSAESLLRRWQALPPTSEEASRLIQIPVRYEGEDLEEWARHARMSVSEAITRHSEPLYKVALIGFAPGFPYLQGLPPDLHMPRRTMPRATIPAGSVAIGGSHTGIYSIPSPGGWNLIGSTEVRLFDPAKEEEAFLLRPGDRVQFLPVVP